MFGWVGSCNKSDVDRFHHYYPTCLPLIECGKKDVHTIKWFWFTSIPKKFIKISFTKFLEPCLDIFLEIIVVYLSIFRSVRCILITSFDCVEKEGVICVCCIYIPKTYMTLTPLIKITVVLCGRFEFIFYAMQLLHFKWISRYEKTNAYILIIYLFCLNIYNEIHTFIFITFSSTSHIQPLAVKNWLKSMMKRNCVHSTKRGWHQKCQLTVLEMNGRYDDFTNKDRDIIWKLEPLACYFCFTFLEIIFL